MFSDKPAGGLKNKAAARIAIAKAAGILSEDVLLAEDMLVKHRATKDKTRGKTATGRKRAAPATKADTGKPPPPTKKATRKVAKKATRDT